MATWEGKCPICGMKLMASPVDTARPNASACPMHPEITATWAVTCPERGMTLRPTEAGGDTAEHEGHETTAQGTRMTRSAASSGKTTWSS